jgi:hypothetical protein
MNVRTVSSDDQVPPRYLSRCILRQSARAMRVAPIYVRRQSARLFARRSYTLLVRGVPVKVHSHETAILAYFEVFVPLHLVLLQNVP